MNEIFYYLFIPISLSALSSIIFLSLFSKSETIRLTFLMKHLAILQIIDLFLMIVFVSSKLVFYHNDFYSQLICSISRFFQVYQSYWLATISHYIYKVVCLKKDRNKTSLLKHSLICFIISIVEPIINIGFGCFEYKSEICKYICSDVEKNISYSVVFLFFLWGI